MAEPKKRKRVRDQAPKPSKEAGVDENPGDPPPAPDEKVEATTGEEILPDLDLVEAGVFAGPDDQGTVVGQHNGRGVGQLLHDQQFVDQMISEMVANRTMEGLVEDISDRLSDSLAVSPEFRRRVINAFMANEVARGKFVRATIRAFS